VTVVRTRWWLLGPLALMAVSITLFAVPSQLEGPVMVLIGPGHGLSWVDALAFVPLLFGLGWIDVALWKRRTLLLERLANSPGKGGILVLLTGVGVGLLIASSFSTFFWWWAIGRSLLGSHRSSSLLRPHECESVLYLVPFYAGETPLGSSNGIVG
jgi:hypothetical protein